MLILGFGNKARQGKDTAAEAIRDFYASYTGTEFRPLVRVGVFKFASALYQEVNDWLKVFNGFYNWENATIEEVTLLNIAGRTTKCRYVTALPSWVQPDPNPEISEIAPYGKHPKLLQWWGSEFRRKQDPDYWTKKLFASIPNNLDIALITDVRFPNEADGIKARGGFNVNVQRLNEDGTQYYSSDRPADHLSETGLDDHNWDFYIKNKEGHAALTAEQAITIAEYLRGLNKNE